MTAGLSPPPPISPRASPVLLDLSSQFVAGTLCASSLLQQRLQPLRRCERETRRSRNVAVWNAPLQPGVANVQGDYSETFVVRSGVPEPGSLALLGLGIAGLGALRRRTAKA
jgi:hypothetical protein